MSNYNIIFNSDSGELVIVNKDFEAVRTVTFPHISTDFSGGLLVKILNMKIVDYTEEIEEGIEDFRIEEHSGYLIPINYFRSVILPHYRETDYFFKYLVKYGFVRGLPKNYTGDKSGFETRQK